MGRRTEGHTSTLSLIRTRTHIPHAHTHAHKHTQHKHTQTHTHTHTYLHTQVLLHGLGDTAEKYASFGKTLQLPSTTVVALQGTRPLGCAYALNLNPLT